MSLAVRILPAGPSACLVETADTRAAVGLAAWARDRGLAREVVAGASTVLLDGLRTDDPARDLAEWPGPGSGAEGRLVTLDVEYDGADLSRVARAWAMTEREVVATHTRLEFTAAFTGFAPGFAYLVGLPSALAVPRLETPRPRVPTGSVALAAGWCGIYPRESPGGWLLLGRTDAVLWDVGRTEPALLTPGTRVRFRECP